MNFKILLAFLIIFLISQTEISRAASRNLDGWDDFKFEMTTVQVLQKTGPIAEKEINMQGIPIIRWSAVVLESDAEVVAFVPNGKLNKIMINFDTDNGTLESCRHKMTAVVGELSKKYGKPSVPLVKYGENALHAIFKFANGGTITADGGIVDYGVSVSKMKCHYHVLYESNKSPSKGL